MDEGDRCCYLFALRGANVIHRNASGAGSNFDLVIQELILILVDVDIYFTCTMSGTCPLE